MDLWLNITVIHPLVPGRTSFNGFYLNKLTMMAHYNSFYRLSACENKKKCFALFMGYLTEKNFTGRTLLEKKERSTGLLG